MKNKSFIIFGFISFVLVITLFTIAIDYKVESKKADATFNSGIVYIDSKKIKLPISLEEFKKQFPIFSFQSEFYDEENYYYYDSIKQKSNSLKANMTSEGIITTNKKEIGVFITNLKDKTQKVSNCYITGIRLNKNTKLPQGITLNTKLEEVNQKLKTGKMNPFKEEYDNLIIYKKDYRIEITHNNKEITDIIYQIDYEKCKEKSCSTFLN